MAKLLRDDFIKKYNDMFEDENFTFNKDNFSIELIEDIADSIDNEESEELINLRKELEEAKRNFLELKDKYKKRFLNAIEDNELDTKTEELEEKEIVDVKEI